MKKFKRSTFILNFRSLSGQRASLFLIFFLVSLLSFIQAQEIKEKFIPVFLPDGQKIIAELAVTPLERQRGLMFREELAADEGMLFVFEEDGLYSFWMKNMKFSIDILWLDKNKRIIHLEENVPPCTTEPCPSYTPALPSRYVLELKAGSIKTHSLKLFQQVDFILPRLK
ncbi:DUF192 domain-containing protein [Candidatus Aminicenantes bacterium AC-334-K16]|jgi:hypothetical protein|nr:DUF192 domain-containing protein [Candidatus Aminicenantes bacterium AC-334-K16]